MAETRRLKELAASIEEVADLPDGPLAVALSGGADSAALLWYCRRVDRPVRAIHVHHGLPASDRLADAAASISAALEVDLSVENVELGEGPSAENQARIVRYAALDRQVGPGEWILTGHTSDDQAETVLMHLLRASGLDGLKGIPARRPPFARPFLRVSGATTREVATLAGLEWIVDPVNLEPDPLRNQIRQHLLPLLEGYNPRLRRALATTARLAATDLDYLDSLVEVPIEVRTDRVAVPASALTTLAASPASRLVRRFLASAGLESASPGAVAGVLAVADGAIERHEAGGGLTVERDGPMVVVFRPTGPPAPVKLEGHVRFGAWTFDAFVTDQAPAAMPLSAAWMVADADTVGDLQVVPARDDYDDVLHKAGVPARDRPSHPVVVSPAGAVWVPGVRRLGVGWVEPATRRYLVVVSGTERRWQR